MAQFMDGVPGFRVGLGAGDADEDYGFGIALGEEPGNDALRLGTTQLGDGTGFLRAGIAVGMPTAGESGLPGLPALPSLPELSELPALPDVSPEAIVNATVTVTEVIGDVTINVLPGIPGIPALPDAESISDVVDTTVDAIGTVGADLTMTLNALHDDALTVLAASEEQVATMVDGVGSAGFALVDQMVDAADLGGLTDAAAAGLFAGIAAVPDTVAALRLPETIDQLDAAGVVTAADPSGAVGEAADVVSGGLDDLLMAVDPAEAVASVDLPGTAEAITPF